MSLKIKKAVEYVVSLVFIASYAFNLESEERNTMSKFVQKSNGLLVKKKLPTRTIYNSKKRNKMDFDSFEFDELFNHRDEKVKVITVGKQVIAKTTKIPESESSLGGIALTGFIDIEKLIHVEDKCIGEKRVFFLEKILPFQILELELERECHEEE